MFRPHELNVEAKLKGFIDRTCSVDHKMDAELQESGMGLSDFS